MYDSEGLKILTERECRELLGSVPLGRIVYTDRALPAVQPVNFVMAGGEVVILTSAGSKLAAAARNAVVAFEIDQFDHEITTGWSVVIIGHARVIAEDGEISRLRDLPLRPWTAGEPAHYIAITPELISGRRLPTPKKQAQTQKTKNQEPKEA
ncbi:pyridoxamine 5'-phosphate oxidase family protein [Actinoallomurus iriomotensis]|uniref:Pyridoxamine 5'-phosphate oxidase n=1 Tax=Actinoallomurus iriomotensis TaxID=478107 RepID=A0A9W6RXI0_9ACTN|nr:pyridoxamine 5'-phosphate oxidase family protein [Actinoallomurus iriomotensis]GLY81942.1 pyridoxamine 5'-phosphate oxidase [Actinoallomurus iriomotensis]